MVCFHIVNRCNRLHRLMKRSDEKKWKCSMFLRTVQWRSCILQTRTESLKPFCIRCVMVCKIGFTIVTTNWNAKIALLRASMVVTYYIKLFRMGVDRRNGTLMSLLLLVTATTKHTVRYGLLYILTDAI